MAYLEVHDGIPWSTTTVGDNKKIQKKIKKKKNS